AAAGGRRGPAPRGARPAAPAEAPELIPDDWEPPAAVGDYGSARRLADEAAVLGLLLSRPPASLFSARAELVARRRGLPPLAGSASLPGLEGSRASLAGVVIAAKEVLDRQGRPMAFYSFEDEEGLFEAVLFPQAYARGLPTLEGNSALLVVGTIECDYGVPSIHAEEVFGLNRPDRD
ncbi:MAG TPA: OB-fold nucleic acid binding domain-containing protein, partial [Spirochaetia bacterium]|nr:OB-fold nucleic acid binding domain-containing protein [Spirochaetia bacterium]